MLEDRNRCTLFSPFPQHHPPTIAAAELRQNLNLKMGKKTRPQKTRNPLTRRRRNPQKNSPSCLPPRVSLLPPPPLSPPPQIFRKGGRKIFPCWTYPTRNKIFLSRVGAIAALAHGGPPTPTPKQTPTTKIVLETGLFSVVRGVRMGFQCWVCLSSSTALVGGKLKLASSLTSRMLMLPKF